MIALDILEEHGRARPLSAADLHAFVDDGVPSAALSWTPDGRVSMVARDRVVFGRESRFEFECYQPDGEAVNAFTLPLQDQAGDVADILAWRPGVPPALWLGRVGLIGEEEILAPRLCEALDVWPDILTWLRAGRRGVVILNPGRAASLLDGVTLQASAEHARWLRNALARPAPPVLVRESSSKAIAVAGRAA